MPIQHTSAVDTTHAQNIASNLNQAGHPASAQSVTPTTAATPIEKTPMMEAIGADVIGEDIAHVVGTTVGDMTMGVQKTRITSSKRFLGKLIERIRRKKNPQEEEA